MAKKKLVWKAYLVEGRKERLAGTLALEAGRLSVVSAKAPTDREYLDDVVQDLNARDHLVELAPPKKSDETRYGMGAVEYRRNHPDFAKVLIKKLRESHDLKVKPAK